MVYPDCYFAVVVIQTWTRMITKRRFYIKMKYTILVQANGRRFICRIRYIKIRCAIMMQAIIRCFIHRRRYISTLHQHYEIKKMNLTNRIRLDIAKLVTNRNIAIGTNVIAASIVADLEQKKYELMVMKRSIETIASRTVVNVITSVTVGTALIIRARRERILPLLTYYLKHYYRKFKLRKIRRSIYTIHINDIIQRVSTRHQLIAEYVNSIMSNVMDRKLALQNYVGQTIGTALAPYITR